jgi:hypothetical protein
LNKKAGALGFEPRSTDSKSGVLPLHHAPTIGIADAGMILHKICDLGKLLTFDKNAGQDW